MYKLKLSFSFSIVLWFISIFSLFAETEIDIEKAAQLEYYRENGKKVVKATGKVTLRYKDAKLLADEVVAYMDKKDVIAKGHVFYQSADMMMFADEFKYNLDTRVGTIINAQIFNETAYITGEIVRKTGLEEYEAEKASYTSCKTCIEQNEPPHWQIRAQKLQATVEGYARTTNATFNVLDMPVVYVPWFAFPVKTKRQTGFLPPSLVTGLSGSQSPGLSFFWAMSNSYDATWYYEYISGHGHKNGLEFNYAPNCNTNGSMKFFFIKDRSLEYRDVNRNPNNNRWVYTLNHRQDFTKHFRLRAKSSIWSDQYYLSHFDKEPIPGPEGKALKSSVVLVYDTENTISSMENSFYYHMTARDQKDVTHKLPEFNFFSTTSPIFSNLPLFYNLDFTYTYFAKKRNRLYSGSDALIELPYDYGNDGISGTNDPDGSEGDNLISEGETGRGHRFILKPELYIPLNIFNYFILQPSLINTTYLYVPQAQVYSSERTPYKNVWDFNVDFSTVLEKDFTVSGDSYRHKMFPELRYISRWGEYKKGAQPYFDSYDETGKIRKLAFILDNLIIREKNYFELFQLIFDQRVNIEYWIRRTNADEEEAKNEAGIGRVLDPFKVVAKVNLPKTFHFLNTISGKAELYYDHYDRDINRVNADLTLKDIRGDKLSLTYTKDTRDPISKDEEGTALEEASSEVEDEDIHYLKTAVAVYVNKNYTLSYENHFSISDKVNKRHLEAVGLRFKPNSKCWWLDMKYRIITNGKKDNKMDLGIEINWGIMQI